MRLGVLDVGSNTVHLVVVDAHRGGHPTPMHKQKVELRLAESLTTSGALSEQGERDLTEAVEHARTVADARSCDELVAFATSAVRDAVNSIEVLQRILKQTGVELRVLAGEEEARLTFLAVRRWYGWSAGQLLCVDIGGGSLEISSGRNERADIAISLPLGAGRLTRDWFRRDPPGAEEVARLRQYVDESMGGVVAALAGAAAPEKVVATSKTFRSLARLTGAAPSGEGLRVYRELTLAGLRQLIKFVQHMSSRDLATLEGVSSTRAHQLLAGAVVAESAMRHLDVPRLQICPWALREGVILRRLDILNGA